jgi:hypothetical protein
MLLSFVMFIFDWLFEPLLVVMKGTLGLELLCGAGFGEDGENISRLLEKAS